MKYFVELISCSLDVSGGALYVLLTVVGVVREL